MAIIWLVQVVAQRYYLCVNCVTTSEGIILTPRRIGVVRPSSPIFDHMDQAWNTSFYQIPRKAILIGAVSKPHEFSKPGPPEISANNMVVKLAASDQVYIPKVLKQFRRVIQQTVNYEYAINPIARSYYAYITIRQGLVNAGHTQSHPSIHVDGLQGSANAGQSSPFSVFVSVIIPERESPLITIQRVIFRTTSRRTHSVYQRKLSLSER